MKEYSKSKPHIALVDDNENILTCIAIMLENEDFLVTSYTDGAIALADFREEAPDLVVLDIKMPAIDGMQLLIELRRFSHVPVIFLTSKDDELDEIMALKMGADDFITKPFSQRLLLERIRALLRRSKALAMDEDDRLSDDVLIRKNLLIDPAKHLCKWKDGYVNLTVSEFNILAALVERPGLVKTRDNLLDAAIRDQNFVDDRSIDSHIRRIRKKFKMIDETFDQIETLYGVGYRYNID